MSASNYLFPPSPVYSLPVRGKEGRYHVKRIFCVGRNYHAQAVEMGRPVDKATMKPFYFMKDASTLVESGATVPYPTGSSNYHYEMELVVAIGKEGFRVSAQKTILTKPSATEAILNSISIQSKEISNKLSDFLWSLKIEKGISNNNLKQRLLDYQQFLFAELNIACKYDMR